MYECNRASRGARRAAVTAARQNRAKSPMGRPTRACAAAEPGKEMGADLARRGAVTAVTSAGAKGTDAAQGGPLWRGVRCGGGSAVEGSLSPSSVWLSRIGGRASAERGEVAWLGVSISLPPSLPPCLPPLSESDANPVAGLTRQQGLQGCALDFRVRCFL